MTTRATLILAALLLTCAAAQAVGTETHHVTPLFVSKPGSGLLDGSSWADAMPHSELPRTLSRSGGDNALPQDSIGTALHRAEGKIFILLAAGTYSPLDLSLNQDITALHIFGNFNGETRIQKAGDPEATAFSVTSLRPGSEAKTRVYMNNLTVIGKFDFGNTASAGPVGVDTRIPAR